MSYLDEKFKLKSKNIVITGAAGYFGRHISAFFNSAGANLILLDKTSDYEVLASSQSKPLDEGKIVKYQVDFYDKAEFEKTLKIISKKHDIDVIINNAYDLSPNTGFNTEEGTLESLEFMHWEKAFECGIYWAFLTTKILGEKLKEKKNGSIINISSMYGLVAPDKKLYYGKKFFNPATYGVSKSGIIAFTKYVASFWGQYGIRCNAIAPGAFPNTETRTANSVDGDSDFLDRLKGKSVLNRVGHPKDLEGILLLLASNASSFITGQTFSVDGGWTIV